MSDSQADYLKYTLPMRRRYQALGLTVLGHARKDGHRRSWPQLAGLDSQGREYHRLYMQLRRHPLTP